METGQLRVPQEILWVALAIPFLFLYVLQLFNRPKICVKGLPYILLAEYIFLVLCFAVIYRNPAETNKIQAEWLWGYHNPTPDIFTDNIINIVVFIPLGFLVGCICKRFLFMKAFLAGLFLSETIECSQLIWKRGCFDVDDIINNTVGAMIGASLWCIVIIGSRLMVRGKW